LSKILVIDDEAILRDAIAEAMRRAGHAVDAFESGRPALDAFAQGGVDLVISDLRMPGMDGVAVLEEAKRIAPDVPFIIVTAHGTVETAVGAMKKGAYDFIIKPFKLEDSRRWWPGRWSRACSRRRAKARSGARRRGIVYQILERAAQSDATVLISGGERHRQGSRGADAAPAVQAARVAVPLRELRGAVGGAARERAVRPRAGRVHRGPTGRARAASSSPTAGRCCWTR
jgi:FixJ family two-component response regulator